MAQKVVKVKAHKRLDGNGKVESVDAHVRRIQSYAGKYATVEFEGMKMSGKFDSAGQKLLNVKKPSLFLSMGDDVKVLKTFKNKAALALDNK